MTINSDAPIREKSEDRLGYSPFARALAQAVVDRPSGEGFVIGVQASWGMGKSSAINLMLEAIGELELSKGARQRTRVRHFNPWLFSGLETLVRGYLSELGRAIDETLDQGTPQGTRKVVEKLVKGGAEMVGGAAALAALALSGGAAAPWATSIKSGVTGALNLGAHALENRSLDSMIEALRKHLSAIDCKLLVVLDDLDRLEPDELRQILTLVKTFGNLPNVVHMLVYDRTIVDAGLGASLSGQPTFREKIVQVELDLPPPERWGLRALTFDRMTSIVGPEPPMAPRDWWEVSELAFNHYLRSPRDVVRVMNALSVSWPGVAGEVYVPDFVTVELLRHFERPTYDALRTERAFLTGGGVLGGTDRKAVADRIVATIGVERRSSVTRMLASMFPAARNELNGRVSPMQGAPQLSGRRVGDPRGFDTYFGYAASPHEISVSDLRALAERLSDLEFLKDQFRGAMSRRRPDGTSLAAQLLHELSRLIELRSEVPEELLVVLLEFGDELISSKDEVVELFSVDNFQRLDQLFERVLERLPMQGRSERLRALLTADTASLSSSSLLAGRLGQEHGLVWSLPDEPREIPLLTADGATEVGQAVARRIGLAATDPKLLTLPVIDIVLSVWAAYAGADGPRSFITAQFGNAEALTKLALSTMSETISSSEPHRLRTLRELPDPAIYDAAAMADALEAHLTSQTVPPLFKDDAQRFVRQARRRLAEEPGAATEAIEEPRSSEGPITHSGPELS